MSDEVKYQYVQMILTPGDYDSLTLWMKNNADLSTEFEPDSDSTRLKQRLSFALQSAYITNVRSEEELESLIARNQKHIRSTAVFL